MMPRLLLVVLLVWAPLPVVATQLTAVKDVEDCVSDNLPEHTSVQTVRFIAKDRAGSKKDSEATIYWQQEDDLSKVMIRVTGPPKQRGTGLLFIQKPDGSDRWLYLPALKKTRRITKSTLSGSFLNTDFSYKDLERIQGARDAQETKLLENASVAERAVYVLESRTDADEEFDRVISYVDHETCVILKSEFFEKGKAEPRKVLTADPARIEQKNGTHVPHSLLMRDLTEESQTELVVEKIEIGAKIPSKTFTRKELETGRR